MAKSKLELLEEDGLLNSLVGVRGDGVIIKRKALTSTTPLPPALREPRVCELWVREQVWGQQATVCGVSALNSHEESEDVFVVGKTINTRKRKWVKVEVNPPYSVTTLYEVTWTETKTATPGGYIFLQNAAGEDPPAPVSCDINVEGEKPAGWDGEGIDDPGPDYSIAYEDLPQEEDDRQDLDLVTGSALVSAAIGGEVLIYDSGYQQAFVYGRAFFASPTLTFISGQYSRATVYEVRRRQIDIEMRGYKVSCMLKWELVTSAEGDSGPPTTTEYSQWLDGSTDYHTIILPYPSYKQTVYLTNLRAVPDGGLVGGG